MTNKTLGFIILRHVSNPDTDQLWNDSYDSIRRFYPENPILIIDDNSCQEHITKRELYNTTIINSEYPGRGELLPYYYYVKNKFCDMVVILHDSTFINRHIDFNTDTFRILWNFEDYKDDQPEDVTLILSTFQDNDLLEYYRHKHLWTGCFGGMSVITHDYLSSINEKYNFSLLLDKILNRYNRMSFERVIAVLLHKPHNCKSISLFGIIHNYCKWGLPYSQKHNLSHLPIIKVWTGR
jgi:hypothetical protein